MSARHSGKPLWLISWRGCRCPEPFAGTFAEAIAEINRRHAETGVRHAVMEAQS